MSGSARPRADAGALVLGALGGVAVASDLLRRAAPEVTRGVVNDSLHAGVSDPGHATFVVGAALLLGAVIALVARRRLAATLGEAGALVPLLPAVLAPAVAATGALGAPSLLFAVLALAVAALAAARWGGAAFVERDPDLSVAAFAFGAGGAIAFAAGRSSSAGALLVVASTGGGAALVASALLAAALARRAGRSVDEARPRATLLLAPLAVSVLAPWLLGVSYEGPGWSDERREGLALVVAVLGPVLAALAVALVGRASLDPVKDRDLLRRVVAFAVLPLAAIGLSPEALPRNLDLVHMGERTAAATAVLDGGVPFRSVFMLKPWNDVAVPIAAFALFGRTVGALVRFDALLGPLGSGAEALVASVVLRPRLAALVTAIRLAAPLRVLFGPFETSAVLNPPHRYLLRDLALVALAAALASPRLSKRALAGATLLAALAATIGFDAAVEVLLVLVVGVLARAAATPEARRTLALGAGAPLAALLVVGGAALHASGALPGFFEWHVGLLRDKPHAYGTIFDAASDARDPLAVPLRALRLYGPPAFALAVLALAAARSRSVALERRALGATLVALTVLVATPAVMTRSDSAHLDAASRLAPVLLAFAVDRGLRLLAEEPFVASAEAALPWIGAALLALGAQAPEALERVARRGLTPAAGDVSLAAPRAHGVAVPRPTALACDALLARVSREPPGPLFTFVSSPLMNFLADRPSPTPFALTGLLSSTWERRATVRALRARPPAAVVLLPPRPGLPEELREPEVTAWLWSTQRPVEQIGPYLLLEPRERAKVLEPADAPAVNPAVEAIAAGARDLGHVPEAWGREGLTTEVGAGAVLARFPGVAPAGALAGWRDEPGPGLIIGGAPFDPEAVGFLRIVFVGAGRALVAFTTTGAPEVSRGRTLGLAVRGPHSVALVPVGAFASWHWSGKVFRIFVRGDGSDLEVESVELLAPSMGE